ncbi:hypothetical protein L3i22_083640 [Actinoplanes sp. L3-i22]|nr:hypothetical protein L3i22_083640 [Actinoplanes sp. L3-i22]
MAGAALLVTALFLTTQVAAANAAARAGGCRLSYYVPSMSSVEMTNGDGQVVRLQHSYSKAHAVEYRYLWRGDNTYTMRVRDRQAEGRSTELPNAPGLSLVLRSTYGTEIFNGSVRQGTQYRVGIQACGTWYQSAGSDLHWRSI